MNNGDAAAMHNQTDQMDSPAPDGSAGSEKVASRVGSGDIDRPGESPGVSTLMDHFARVAAERAISPPRPRRILIIGGNMRQAEHAAREARISHSQCTYVGLAEGLRGKLPSPYWLVGTWQMRRDLPEIFQELRRGDHYAWLPGEPIVERG